jgi:hypothetical protein
VVRDEYGRLFSPRRPTMRQVMWQDDIVSVVRFVTECLGITISSRCNASALGGWHRCNSLPPPMALWDAWPAETDSALRRRRPSPLSSQMRLIIGRPIPGFKAQAQTVVCIGLMASPMTNSWPHKACRQASCKGASTDQIWLHSLSAGDIAGDINSAHGHLTFTGRPKGHAHPDAHTCHPSMCADTLSACAHSRYLRIDPK